MKQLLTATLTAGLGLVAGGAWAGCGTCSATVVAPVRLVQTVPCATYSAPCAATVPCATTTICRPAPAIPDMTPPYRVATPCGRGLLGVPSVLGEIFTPQPK